MPWWKQAYESEKHCFWLENKKKVIVRKSGNEGVWLREPDREKNGNNGKEGEDKKRKNCSGKFHKIWYSDGLT